MFFDERCDGYVRAEGGGVFLLKDYDQALADGDRILASVAASGVNTDGRKAGMTVPKYTAQAALINQTMKQASLAPDELDYLEAHGTGTPVGDPIEARAIGMALGQGRRCGPLPIGSVKSNMGHLETASGVAGLVKAIYSLQHRIVPATIDIQQPNPHILLDEWNIQPVAQNLPLRESGILSIGVNSFGFGGANAHVILQSAERSAPPAPAEPETQHDGYPLIVSARTPEGLKKMQQHLPLPCINSLT